MLNRSQGKQRDGSLIVEGYEKTHKFRIFIQQPTWQEVTEKLVKDFLLVATSDFMMQRKLIFFPTPSYSKIMDPTNKLASK